MQKFTFDQLTAALRASVGADGFDDLDDDVLDTPFAELGYDSLVLLELAGHVQRTFGIPMPDEAPQHMRTPRAALDYINTRCIETGV